MWQVIKDIIEKLKSWWDRIFGTEPDIDDGDEDGPDIDDGDGGRGDETGGFRKEIDEIDPLPSSNKDLPERNFI
ncbi:hypothetical protein FLX35_07770 [Cylindrospermopsis raciborskii LB2897]|nr:hypothetical protein [Cylindrospermopsis raciborskii LB2897]